MVMLQGMSTAVYFACYYCELPYVAEREELTSQHSGTIDCVNCNQSRSGGSTSTISKTVVQCSRIGRPATESDCPKLL
jgi:hypothetical protein